MVAKFDKSGKHIESISDDDIKVICFLKDVTDGRQYVKLSFSIPGEEQSPKAIVPLKDVNSKDIVDYLPDIYIMRFSSNSQQAVYMRQIISEAQHSNCPRYDIIKQGYSTDAGGNLLYGFGDCIIGSDSSRCAVWNPKNLKANIDLITKTSYVKLFDWVYAWAKQSEHLAALLIVALSPFVYPICKELYSPSEALNAYLVGKTGSGKTSFATLLTDLFQGKEYSFSLIANKEVFYELVKHRSHVPILIDDLNKSASSYNNHKKIGKASDLLQTKSSAGTFDGDLSAEDLKKISLIITAEETLRSPSSMNRCVVIKFPDSFDANLLTELQTNNLFPMLAYRLISWICHSREEICKRVANEILKMKPKLPYESITSSGEARMCMSYKTMLITQTVIMEFVKLCIRGQDNYMKKYIKLNDCITNGIIDAIRNTKEAARRFEDNNALAFLVNLFKYDPDRVIAKSVGEYFSSDDKIIFGYEGIYYFRGEKMQEYLKSHFYTISNKKFSSELEREGLLYTRNKDKDRSYPLPKELRKRYNEDVRYYRIYADKLNSLVANNCDTIFELFGSHIENIKKKGI